MEEVEHYLSFYDVILMELLASEWTHDGLKLGIRVTLTL